MVLVVAYISRVLDAESTTNKCMKSIVSAMFF